MIRTIPPAPPGALEKKQSDKKQPEKKQDTPAPAQQSAPQKRSRSKKPDTLPDGRILGSKTKDFVPEHMRRSVPDSPHTNKRGRLRSQVHNLNMMCRTRLPLSLTSDGDVNLDGHVKIRINGFNQAKFNAILAGIQSGMRISETARLAGLAPSTIRFWFKRAREGVYPYTVLVSALEEAEAKLERQLLESIRDIGLKTVTWQETMTEEIVNEHGEAITKTRVANKVRLPQYGAAAWILERTRPEVYRSDRPIGQQEELDIEADIQDMEKISDVREDQQC